MKVCSLAGLFIAVWLCVCQEARELAVRGIDGKGMHILDVLPASFSHVPGCAERRGLTNMSSSSGSIPCSAPDKAALLAF